MSEEVSFRSHVPFLLYLTGMYFLNFIARIILGPLLPVIEGDLNIGHGEAGALFFYMSLGLLVGFMGSGFVASHLTHRWTIILSSVALGGSLLVVSLGHSLWWIRTGLIIVGLSAGLYLPSGIATLTDVVSSKHWGKAIAIHELAPNLSFVAAPLLAEGLMIWVSWRGVMAVLGLAALAAGAAFIRLGKGGVFPGEPPSPKNLRVLLGLPSLWITMGLFCIGIGMSLAVYNMLPLYLVAEQGFERVLANTLIGLARVAGLGVVILAGWLTDRFGPKRTLAGVFLATGMATIFLGMARNMWIIPAMFLQPVSACCFFPAGFAALSKIGPPRLRNLAVSLINPVGFLIGGGAMPAGVGILGDHGLFSLGFVLVGLLVIGSILLLRYLKFHPDAVERK
jgi:NNP family nitrate/nitrite transporter-like MFS transporter